MCSLEISDSDAGVMRLKREMLKSLKDQMESNEYYSLATLLDTRFKQRVLSSSSSAALAKQMLTTAHEELEMERISDMSSKRVRLEQPEQSQDDTNSAKKLLWKYCDQFMDENSEKGSSLLPTQSVIDNYLKEPALSRRSDPLAYWKSN